MTTEQLKQQIISQNLKTQTKAMGNPTQTIKLDKNEAFYLRAIIAHANKTMKQEFLEENIIPIKKLSNKTEKIFYELLSID